MLPSEPPRLILAASAALRFSALREVLLAFPPAQEVLILGGSRLPLDDLVRSVAAVRPTFGLHRMTLLSAAVMLGAFPLAAQGLSPVSHLGLTALVARTAFEAYNAGELQHVGPVVRAPSFPRALLRTLDELHAASVAPDSLRDLGPGAHDVAVLLRRYGLKLAEAKIADRAVLLREAAGALAVPPSAAHARFAAMPKVFVDLPITEGAEAAFVRALAQGAPSTIATLPSGDTRSRRALTSLGFVEEPLQEVVRTAVDRLKARLFAPEQASATPEGEDPNVVFFSAPGEGREMVEVVRRIHDEAKRGVRFDEMAVLLRSPELYRDHLEHALRRGSVPAYFSIGTKRPHPSGRAFRALLACAREGLSANRFAEYLSLGQVPTAEEVARAESSVDHVRAAGDAVPAGLTGTPVPPAPADDDEPPTSMPGPVSFGTLRAPHRWEKLLVDASVLGGKDRWARRLAGLEADLRREKEGLAREEPESAKIPLLERSMADLHDLRDFVLPIIERLATFSVPCTWGEWFTRLGDLAGCTLRRPEAVLTRLAELLPMGDIGPVPIDEVCEVLADALSTIEEPPPLDRHGRVLVTSIGDVRGLSMRVVFVPGLAERLFPIRPREDPLLLDDVRRLVAERGQAPLMTQADRSHDERLLLHLAVGAAEERIYLSYPRVETAESRPRVPSFYGLDVLRATTGVLPDTDTIERDAARVAGARLAWPAPKDATRAIDDVEHDLAILGPLLRERGADRKGRARYLLELHKDLGRSLRARYARWEVASLNGVDGLVHVSDKTLGLLAKRRPTEKPYSATALQHFAACPYRFYLSAIMGLAPRETGARIDELAPAARGQITHEVQAEVLRTLRDRGDLPLDEALLPEAQELCDRVLDEVAGRFEDELAPPILRVWRDDIERIRGDLGVWLKTTAAPTGPWIPAHFELSFGLGQADGPDSRKEAVQVGDRFLMRGAVDLVERHLDGRALRVTDYKTGMNFTQEGLMVGGGEVLQPVLYGLAVEAMFAGVSSVPVEEGRLYFCTAKASYSERVVPLDGRARRAGLGVLTHIDRAIQSGQLLPLPREEDTCKRCVYRAVCGPHELERMGRKQKKPESWPDPGLLEDLTNMRREP